MITIKDALGKGWNTIKIYDDETNYGGKSHSDERLGEFMLTCEISPFDDINKLQRTLKECGLKEIEQIDDYVRESIEKELEEIEDKFNVDILDYTWGYKY